MLLYMGMLGKYFKLAGIVLILSISLYPQAAQGEGLGLAGATSWSSQGGGALELVTNKNMVLRDTAEKNQDIIKDSISWAEPAVAVAIIMPPSVGEGVVSVSSLVHALDGAVIQETQGQLVAKLPTGNLVITDNNMLVNLGEQDIVLQTKPLFTNGHFYLGLVDVCKLWQRQATVEGQEIVLLPGTDHGQDFVWEELRTFSSGPAWYVVGRVKNRALLAAELIKISWEVGGEEGQVLATAEGYIQLLNPGESKPFKLMLPLRPDAAWYRVRLTPGFGAKPRSAQLTASAEPYADRGVAYISLLGQLTNEGQVRQDFIKVMVEFLDEKGRLVDVDWAFINYLDPGESESFTVYTPQLEAIRWRITLD